MGEASQEEELQHEGPDYGMWGAESSQAVWWGESRDYREPSSILFFKLWRNMGKIKLTILPGPGRHYAR